MNYTASWTHLVEYCVERSQNSSLRTRYQLAREKWVELNIALSDNFLDEAAEPEDIEGLALRTQLKNDYTTSLTEFKSIIQAAENLFGPDEVMTWRNNMLDKPVTLEPLEREWQEQKEELDKLYKSHRVKTMGQERTSGVTQAETQEPSQTNEADMEDPPLAE
jgi:preprotein translocase subunit SecA